MKTLFYYISIMLCVSSCKGQKIPVKSKDIIVFEFKGTVKNTQDIKYIEPYKNAEIYNKNKLIVITQRWSGYGSSRLDKIYSFKKNKDTMTIYCHCGQEKNNYFKNLQFKKGNYELKVKNLQPVIKGSKIQVDDRLKKTTFIHTYVVLKNNTKFKNVLFKKLDFDEISLGSKGVIWKKRDPLNKL